MIGTGGDNKRLNFGVTVTYFYKRVIVIVINYNLASSNCKCNSLLLFLVTCTSLAETTIVGCLWITIAYIMFTSFCYEAMDDI